MKKKNKEEKKTTRKDKKKKNAEIKTILEVMPIRDYDYDINAFYLENGNSKRYLDIVEIKSIDRKNSSNDENRLEIYKWSKFYKLYGEDIKFVAMKFPYDTKEQQDYLAEIKDRTADPVRIKWLNREIRELQVLEKTKDKHRTQYYMFIFAKDKEKLVENRKDIMSYLNGYTVSIEEVEIKNKIQILKKLMNMNTRVLPEIGENFEEYSNEDDIKNVLIETIQPTGGIDFRDPNYIICGDGYVRVLHIYRLAKVLRDNWLDSILEHDDTIVTIDISTKDKTETKKNLNKAIKEENAKANTATEWADYYDARTRKDELQNIYNELNSYGEVIKMVDLRIFVIARSLVELDDKCSDILDKLKGDDYEGTTCLNEGKREWQSILEDYKSQHSKLFSMKAHPLLTEQLAYGNPFNFSELVDPTGSLLGFTNEGAVLFDEFTKTKKRRHYNSLVCGNMGSGKSTMLKKRFKAHAAAGDFVRTFDISGEFADLTKEFGGKIIKCNGRDGILNPLEILNAGDDDNTSYAKHISKVKTFFKCINPELIVGNVLIDLEIYLKLLYEKFELTPAFGKPITGRSAKKYPILTDFYNFLEEEFESLKNHDFDSKLDFEVAKNKAIRLTTLKDIVHNLVTNYGHMFDGHTSVDNIVDEKIVTFDISDIKDLGSQFKATMFNLVSLCWDNAVTNGIQMKKMWDSKSIRECDITDFLILIDESHRWVNTSMPFILEILIRYLREARKYFAGITLASQSVRDFMPEGENSEYLDLIRTLFELTQYKFLFNLDGATVPYLNKILGNTLTSTQIDRIPKLEIGRCILSIAGDRSIEFDTWLSKDYEESLFAGGR